MSKTRLTLAGLYPFQALTRSLHLPHPAPGTSPPGRTVVAGSCRDERPRDIPQSLPCSLVSAAKPTTGIQVVRAWRPLAASTRSLLMPTEQGRSTPSPIKRKSRAVPPFLPRLVADPLADLTQTRSLQVGASFNGTGWCVQKPPD